MDDKIAQFCQVTGCVDPAKAKFFLESSNGEIDAAISAFFGAPRPSVSPRSPIPNNGPRTLTLDPMTRPPSEHGDQDIPTQADPTPPVPAAATTNGGGASGSAAAPPPARKPATRRGPARLDNVKGFGDMNGDDDDEDDEDKPTEWYTGGAQSGSVVQDPKKKPTRVEDILDGARAAGAVDGTAEDLEDPSKSRRGGGTSAGGAAFRGSGNTLGGNGQESTAVGAPASTPGADGGAVGGADPAPLPIVITFWTNGFTVDSGELRKYDDPANAPFMQAVANGQCPPELAPADRNQPININLVRKETVYEPPPEPKYRAFQGSGRTLGGTSGPSPEAAAAAPTPGPSSSDAAAGTGEWSVDENTPSTSIQLRLRDGSRIVGKFNLTHAVSDIRNFIRVSSPANGTGAYTLQLSGFPPKKLEDDAQLVSDGLANSVIIQR